MYTQGGLLTEEQETSDHGWPLGKQEEVSEDWNMFEEQEWYDMPEADEEGPKCADLALFDDADDFKDKEQASDEIMNLSWRSQPEDWQGANWVRVESVVDSGASAPVAPPTMLPGVPIAPSEGSKRGQQYTSASKHRLKNLGQQQISACTEDGDPTSVLFQIADVSKPLVSVSSICERGNRVIFGRSGGVVKNLKNGREIPFYRKNGIYVLSLWLRDSESPDFAGQ